MRHLGQRRIPPSQQEAKGPRTKAEWNAFYARLNRLIALFIDSNSEAGKLVRHIDMEMDSLFTFLHEEGVDPTNNFGERMLRMPYAYGNAAKGPAVIKGSLEMITATLANP
jgi:transposase